MLREGYNYEDLPQEMTPDVLQFPSAQDLTGPECSLWNREVSSCDVPGEIGSFNDENEGHFDGSLSDTLAESNLNQGALPGLSELSLRLAQRGSDNEDESPFMCDPVEIPRATVPIVVPRGDAIVSGSSGSFSSTAANVQPVEVQAVHDDNSAFESTSLIGNGDHQSGTGKALVITYPCAVVVMVVLMWWLQRSLDHCLLLI